MIRKEVTGWRATTPLSEEEELGGWRFSVAVDITYLLSPSIGPDRRA
jgi:hypothetical protein